MLWATLPAAASVATLVGSIWISAWATIPHVKVPAIRIIGNDPVAAVTIWGRHPS
jgi:hypothetical protein